MRIRFFPTLRDYKKEFLAKDIFSGIIIAAVSIPISMGYAQISGLPAAYGLYGSMLPILFFCIIFYIAAVYFRCGCSSSCNCGRGLVYDRNYI